MSDFLFNVLRTFPLVSALLLVAAIKTKRETRVVQLGIALIASVYLVFVLIMLYRFNSTVFDILDSMSQVLPIGSVRQGTGTYYLLQNLLVIFAFLAIKAVLLPISLRLLKRWQQPLANVVEGIYELNPETSVWLISRKFSNLRKYFKVFYWTSVGITVLLIALVFTFPNWPGFTGVAFPALAALVIGEIYFAYDGVTEKEYIADVKGEQDSANRIVNFGPLRQILKEVFPDRVLSDEVHMSSRASLGSGFVLGELVRSNNESERLAGAYFGRLRQAREDIDVNLVSSSLDLMSRRSVLINNPFYVDLTPYICLPVYHELLQSKRVLIVAGRDSLSMDLKTWMNRGLEDITGVPDLWNVDLVTTEGHNNLHVGILPFADVHNLDLLRNNSEFLSGVEFVVLAEPSRMLATGQLGLSLLLSKCGGKAQPTFVAFDGNHDGLVDSMSHLLKASFTEVVASSLPSGASAEVVWRSDGPNMHGQILPRISRYLGMGTEIGAVALKYQVRKFHWVGGDAFPVVDMKWIAEQYYAQINEFANIEMSQDALEEAFVAIANPWAVEKADNYFLIVEDEISNLFETIRRYATRARQSGFVNLISENYLLRDYMVANHELFSSDAKAIPSIVPDFARTERNLALRMIMSMSWSEVSYAELLQEFELIGQAIPMKVGTESAVYSSDILPPAIERLRDLIKEHMDVYDAAFVQLTNFELGEKANDGNSYFRIEDSPALGQVLAALRPAYVYVEDELGGVNRIGSLLFDHVYQALLPGQFVTYAGKYYEVQSIGSDDSRSGVVLRRAADHIRDRRSYRQWRNFTLTEIVNRDLIGSVTNRSGLQMRRASANIQVDSQGYFELRSRSDLQTAKFVQLDGIPMRKHQNKSLLEVVLPDVPPGVRKTITLLLNEIFVTLFPYSHPYIIALTLDDENEFGSLLSSIGGDIAQGSIYIVEDSMIDLGLIDTVERNWDRCMEIIVDYLTWYVSPEDTTELINSDEVEFVLSFPELPVSLDKRTLFGKFIHAVKSKFQSQKELSSTNEMTSESLPDSTQESALEVQAVDSEVLVETDSKDSTDVTIGIPDLLRDGPNPVDPEDIQASEAISDPHQLISDAETHERKGDEDA